ncbi:hypothetical protein EDD85DRAFT_949373 [Armillaria nabsnona]|nr:hypothetical protein EDD85DRAFT_949373 [Armillaria nabsnona]
MLLLFSLSIVSFYSQIPANQLEDTLEELRPLEANIALYQATTSDAFFDTKLITLPLLADRPTPSPSTCSRSLQSVPIAEDSFSSGQKTSEPAGRNWKNWTSTNLNSMRPICNQATNLSSHY